MASTSTLLLLLGLSEESDEACTQACLTWLSGVGESPPQLVMAIDKGYEDTAHWVSQVVMRHGDVSTDNGRIMVWVQALIDCPHHVPEGVWHGLVWPTRYEDMESITQAELDLSDNRLRSVAAKTSTEVLSQVYKMWQAWLCTRRDVPDARFHRITRGLDQGLCTTRRAMANLRIELNLRANTQRNSSFLSGWFS